jgi:hypothetical protein
MKNTMKFALKVAAMISLCLIMFEGDAQSLPTNDDLFENEFVSFSYDGGMTIAYFTSNNQDLLTPSFPKHTIIKRSSMEDIMKENEENDQMMNIVGQTIIHTIEPAILAASKN